MLFARPVRRSKPRRYMDLWGDSDMGDWWLLGGVEEGLEEGEEFVGGLAVLGYGGVPVGAVAFGRVLGAEDLEVDGQAFGSQLLVDGAEGVDLHLASGAEEHLAGEDNYLCLWLLCIQITDELAVGIGIHVDVVTGG